MHSSGAAHQRVEPSMAQPGAEHDRPALGKGHRDILVVAIVMWREGKVVKQGERLLHERREFRWADPGRELIQEALQRVLVRLDGRAAQGVLSQRGDKLHDEPLRRGLIRGHEGSPCASDGVLERWPLLDSGGADLLRLSNSILVTLSSLKSLFFNGLKKALHFSDNVGA